MGFTHETVSELRNRMVDGWHYIRPNTLILPGSVYTDDRGNRLSLGSAVKRYVAIKRMCGYPEIVFTWWDEIEE